MKPMMFSNTCNKQKQNTFLGNTFASKINHNSSLIQLKTINHSKQKTSRQIKAQEVGISQFNSSKPETRKFKLEIQKRYNACQMNFKYKFPKKNIDKQEDQDQQIEDLHEFNKLKYYNLKQQNQKLQNPKKSKSQCNLLLQFKQNKQKVPIQEFSNKYDRLIRKKLQHKEKLLDQIGLNSIVEVNQDDFKKSKNRCDSFRNFKQQRNTSIQRQNFENKKFFVTPTRNNQDYIRIEDNLSKRQNFILHQQDINLTKMKQSNFFKRNFQTCFRNQNYNNSYLKENHSSFKQNSNNNSLKTTSSKQMQRMMFSKEKELNKINQIIYANPSPFQLKDITCRNTKANTNKLIKTSSNCQLTNNLTHIKKDYIYEKENNSHLANIKQINKSNLQLLKNKNKVYHKYHFNGINQEQIKKDIRDLKMKNILKTNPLKTMHFFQKYKKTPLNVTFQNSQRSQGLFGNVLKDIHGHTHIYNAY